MPSAGLRSERLARRDASREHRRMPTRLSHLVVDTPDTVALARWWAGALGWVLEEAEPEESYVVPPDGAPGIPIVFCPVDDVKRGKNRVHLDFASSDRAEQREIEERLLAAGATRADIGQAGVPWTVLADPDGNELCVLEPRADYDGTGVLAAIVVDAVDPTALARFWAAAAGWQVLHTSPDAAGLRAPDGTGPLLEFVRTGEPHAYKNRIHLDVAGFAGDDQAAEVERLVGLGATRVEVGQSDAKPGEVTWVVLADPEGNEFCVLRSH
jgi:predicted enzyme related to lactoylglutathione lyase